MSDLMIAAAFAVALWLAYGAVWGYFGELWENDRQKRELVEQKAENDRF